MSLDLQQVAAGSVEWILVQIAMLSDEKLELLRSSVHAEEAFSRTPQRCRELSAKLGMSEANARFGLSVIEVIYDSLREDQFISVDDPIVFKQALTELLDSQEFPSSEYTARVAEVLFPLLFQNESAGDHLKLRMLRDGFQPRATGFSSIVDARPVFSQDRNSIKKFFVAAQLRVQLDDDPLKSLTFSVSEEGLRRLLYSAESALKKCVVLRNVMTAARLDLDDSDEI